MVVISIDLKVEDDGDFSFYVLLNGEVVFKVEFNDDVEYYCWWVMGGFVIVGSDDEVLVCLVGDMVDVVIGDLMVLVMVDNGILIKVMKFMVVFVEVVVVEVIFILLIF